MHILTRSIVLLGLALALALFALSSQPALASTNAVYTVNSNLDTDDTLCDSTHCTLREAINAANANANTDTIEFNLGTGNPSIAVGAAGLPDIDQPVTINGNTGGATRIELNGAATGTNDIDGLYLTGDGGSTIKNLVINRFGGDGIEIDSTDGNTIQGLYIGFAPDGTTELDNRDTGIYIVDSPNNIIGGVTPEARNVITSNRDAIFINFSGATGNIIQGNYIGTDVTGLLDRGAGGDGIGIYTGDGNTVGGTAAGAGNVISANSQIGIEIFRSDGNTIQGNIIGLDKNGANALGNFNEGMQITDSSNNLIGGTTHTANTCDGACNVISGNEAEGINFYKVSFGSSNNVIQGNYIGTDKTGLLDRGNLFDGMDIAGVTNNTVGGTAAGAGNVISGNDDDGIFISGGGTSGNVIQGNIIGLDKNGANDLGNSNDGIRINGNASFGYPGANTIGGTSAGARNIISGNDSVGLRINGSGISGIVVQGNFIGTDGTGTLDRGNAFSGVYINAAQNITVGGTSAGAGNLVSGNNSSGVFMENGASGVLVQGNYIGTNAAGTGDIGNSFDGVYIGSPNNTVGGLTAAEANVLSGNDTNGIEIFGNTATGNTVQGNIMGLNAAGTGTLPNTFAGVYVNGGDNNTIGGTASGARNVISGNNGDGMDIQFGATGNTVRGNYIGTDITGTLDLGNAFDGIYVDSTTNTIGGTANGARNIISGNDDNGIFLDTSGAAGNVIAGNSIGTQADSVTALGNGDYGVRIRNASTNTIGGVTTADGNLIAYNALDGIFVESGTANQIRRNAIYSNGGLGIDLGSNGVTANDTLDGDTGANNVQNFPALTTAALGSTIIMGTFNSTPNTTFTLEFFSSPAADGTGNGEGAVFLCDASVTTNGSGDAAVDVTCPQTSVAGNVVTATATRASAPFDTSEFSNAVTVTASNPTSATLVAFGGKANGKGIKLEWTTGNEVELVGFTVWREGGGKKAKAKGKDAWKKLNDALEPAAQLGQVIGADYTFGDKSVKTGKVYRYKLELVKADGTSEWSEIVKIRAK